VPSRGFGVALASGIRALGANHMSLLRIFAKRFLALVCASTMPNAIPRLGDPIWCSQTLGWTGQQLRQNRNDVREPRPTKFGRVSSDVSSVIDSEEHENSMLAIRYPLNFFATRKFYPIYIELPRASMNLMPLQRERNVPFSNNNY
jgi:hypothetical protein